jgi:hypothetical protein
LEHFEALPILNPPQHALSDYVNPPTQQDVPASFTGWPDERLSIPFALRAPTLMMVSFFCGFAPGSSPGATKEAFRYRAENTHRLPTTQTEWFLYQKSKKYHSMLDGVKEGTKFGSIYTGWATLFMVTKAIVDLSRVRLLARGDNDIATG